MMDIVLKIAECEEEFRQLFSIRKDVFVNEQGIFKGSDTDPNDPVSTYLIAKVGDKVVGTVRVYPADGAGHWVGGRLAVNKGHRGHGIGRLLIREAVEYVGKCGCTRFTAHIQSENVDLFSSMGWRVIGGIEYVLGRPHRLMEASLNVAGEASELSSWGRSIQ